MFGKYWTKVLQVSSQRNRRTSQSRKYAIMIWRLRESYYVFLIHSAWYSIENCYWFQIYFNSQTFLSTVAISREYNGMQSRKFYYVFSKAAIFRNNCCKDSGARMSYSATWKKSSSINLPNTFYFAKINYILWDWM